MNIAISRFRWIAFLWIATANFVVADEGVRTWSDNKGTRKVKAKFVSLENGTVTLEREDGQQVEIELKRLSEADRKFIEDRDADPFKPKKSGRKKTDSEPSSAEIKLLTPKLADARAVDPNPRELEWKVTLPVAKSASAGRPRPAALPAKSNFFEKTTGMAIDATGKKAVIGYKLDEHQRGATTRLVVVDLERGKSTAAGTTSGQFEPLAIADDGKRVLVRRDDFGHGNQDRLEVWSIAGSGIEPQIRWTPHDEDKGGDRDIRWGAFVDDEQVITCSSGGKVVLWKIEDAKPVYWMQVKAGCTPALSGDRKLLAFATDKEVGILDVAAGEIVAVRQAASNMAWPAMAFANSGNRLACLAFDKIYTWDLADGKPYREVATAGLHTNAQILWTSDSHVLVGHRYLIDLENQVRLWDYQNAELASSAGDYCWFEISDGNTRPGALVPGKIPSPEIERSLKNAMQDPRFFVLKRGTSVRINVDGITDADAKEKARASLTAKLEANGAKVADTGEIELLATAEQGKEQEISYHTFGAGFGSKSYKIRPFSCVAKFMYQGQEAWRSQAANIPFFVRLKQGETMEQHLREHEKPNYQFFDSVDLPKLLTKPNGQQTLGSSRILPNGIR